MSSHSATHSATIELQSLLEHAGWVRTLAQRLVGDPHLADDLAQETMLAAIETQSQPPRAPRAWLGRVLRNLLWERLRIDHRRARRERVAARPEATAGGAELVESVDAHRTVVNAVMALPEHYRTVLLRRYYQGESPTAIAAALAMPVASVKTRLQRGLELMRRELDRTHGDSGRWRLVLAPLLRLPPVARTSLLSLASLAIVVVLVGAGAWLTVPWFRAAPAPLSVGAVDVGSGLGGAAQGSDPSAPATTPRRALAHVQSEPDIDWGAMKMPQSPLGGGAVFVDGTPARSVLLQFDPDRVREARRGGGTAIAMTGADGAFELTAAGSGVVRAAPGPWVTVLAGVVGATGARQGLCVVVAPPRALVGRVLGPAGAPLGEAHVELWPPEDLRGRLGPRAAAAATQAHSATTDAQGAFSFARLPRLVDATLRVWREGYVTRELQLPVSEAIEVALEPTPKRPGQVEGVVLGRDGTPVADARVSCGAEVTRSDGDGRFRLDIADVPADGARLIAARPGMQPAFLVASGRDDDGRPRWAGSVELRLGGDLREIGGRVLRADGEPAVGAGVWIADPTLFAHRQGTRHETSVGAYAFDAFSAPKAWLQRSPMPETLESYVAGIERAWQPVMVDAQGRFRLRGLCDREYLLLAGDPATNLVSEGVRVAAGREDAELRLAGAVRDKVIGRVVDGLGQPMARVSVSLQVTPCELHHGDDVVFRQLCISGAMVTGQDGAFWVYNVPARDVQLRFDGAGLISKVMTLEALDAPLQVTMVRAERLWVCCTDPNLLDALSVVDAEGRELIVELRHGNEQRRTTHVPVHNGRTEAFYLPETAVAVIGYSAGMEIRRAAIVAGAGELSL